MAYENDILTRNDNDELAVRTVQSVGDNPASSYDDVYTRDNNGKLAVRVVGSGGGDSHNKGYFATQAALEEEYPTGEAGDYAIVGSTDTVWIWDDDNGEWVDTDTKGEVVSVNGKTGTVVLNAEDVGAIPQYSTMPTAASTNEGWIVQFTGTTDATYTHGHLYECVSDGQTPATYSWTEVQLGSGSSLPSQTGNAGKFLTTDGTDASWSDKPLVNTATGNYSMCIGQTGSSASGQNSLAVGSFAQSTKGSVAVGAGAVTTANYTTAIGNQAGCYGGQGAVAIGAAARANAANAIQIAATNNVSVNSDANTVKIANANGNFEMMDANGNLPADRLASTTGLADGNYRLRLTMASGVPTLSWVAE